MKNHQEIIMFLTKKLQESISEVVYAYLVEYGDDKEAKKAVEANDIMLAMMGYGKFPSKAQSFLDKNKRKFDIVDGYLEDIKTINKLLKKAH